MIIKTAKRLFLPDDGQNLVEYALVLILSLVLIFGIVDFSRALYTYHFVSHAAREGARWAMVNGANCSCDSSCSFGACGSGGAAKADVSTHVTTTLIPPGITSSRVTVTVPCGTSDTDICTDSTTPPCPTAIPNAPGCIVQVQVSYSFNFLFPGYTKAATTTFSSTSEMVIAH